MRDEQIPAALYARASRDARGKERSVTRQIDDGLDVVARHKDWKTDPRPDHQGGDLFIDNDIGASEFSRKSREAYFRLLEAIEAGRYGAVVMSVEDRTHRQVLELAEFIKLCKTHGIKVATAGTEYNLEDSDQLSIWYIKVRFAEAEVERLSKRVRDGKRQSAKQGKITGGGHRPFGEQGRQAIRDDDGNVKEVVPIITLSRALVEQDCIREGVDYLLAGGTLMGLAKSWRERGIKTPKGKEWTAVHLRDMLVRPRLAGWRVYHDEIILNDDGTPLQAWTPIVEPAKFEELCALLTNPVRTSTKGSNNQRYPLTGVVYCGRCGARMAGRSRQYRYAGKLLRTYRTYTCQSIMGGCDGLSRAADELEELIFESLFRAVETEDFAEAASSLRREDPTRPHYEALARITADRDRTKHNLNRGKIEDDDFDREMALLDTEERAAWAAIDRMRDGRTRAHVPKNLRAVWPDLALDRQRGILQSVIERITLYPQRGRTFDPDSVQMAVKDWR
jgi:site-specific DNA recombinase